MKRQRITERKLENFVQNLRTSERSAGTIEKYVRDVRKFAAWLEGEAVSRERAAAWRDSLLERGYAPVTVNSMVAAVNRFFAALGWEEYKVKALKIQRRLFRDSGKELSREEYARLVETARRPGGVRTSCVRRSHPGPGAVSAVIGDHLLHGNPGERGEVHHGGGRLGGAGGDLPEREAAGYFAPREAVPETKKVCQAAKNRLR